MRSPHQNDWRELAIRDSDGLEVSLHWSKFADHLKVTVHDGRIGESFELQVDGADALRAFYHPFAYAAGRGLVFDATVLARLDLQPQT